MAAANETGKPSSWCSLLMVQHMNHNIPTLTTWLGLPNTWPRPSTINHDQWWLTARCHLCFEEKLSIPQSTFTSKLQTKSKQDKMTTTASKHHIQFHMRCCMCLASILRAMTAINSHIMLLCTTLGNSTTMPVNTSQGCNAMENSCHIPSHIWWSITKTFWLHYELYETQLSE